MNSLKLFTNNELNVSFTSITYKGDSYFVPSEIGEALGYENLSKSVRQSDGFIENVDYRVFDGPELNDLKAVMSTSDTGLQITNMTRSITLLTESGLNAVLLKSTKPAAVKIRIWITKEVMPSLFTKGHYELSGVTANIKEDAIRSFKVDLEFAELYGCPKHIGYQEATKRLKADYGIDNTELLSTSKYMEDIPENEEMLEPTDIGKKYGISGRKVNLILKAAGLCMKNGDMWEATEKGKHFCTKHAWATSSKSGYNLKWRVSKIQHLFSEK